MKNPRDPFPWTTRAEAIEHIAECLQLPCSPMSIILANMVPPLSRQSLRRWRDNDPELHERLNECAEVGHDATALDIVDISDGNGSAAQRWADKSDQIGPTDRAKFKHNRDAVERDKIRCHYREKLLGRWSYRYAPRQVIAGDDEHPLNAMTDAEVKQRFDELMKKAEDSGNPDPE
jgi:hypothetical protein